MYICSKRDSLQQAKNSVCILQRTRLGKRPFYFLGTFLLIPIILIGCAENPVSFNLTQQQESLPETKVMDYRIAPCDSLWPINDEEALGNALYWLRVMDCAERMGSPQARSLAKTLPTSDWHSIFKRNILTGSAEPTSAERRQIINHLNSYSLQFPHSLRPLMQLWRQQQTLQISLLEERSRYQHLQENADNQIDTLRQNQSHLQSQLQDTSRKLENLTDIERQLSSRKQQQGELPENSTTQQKMNTADKAGSPAKTLEPESVQGVEKGTALPVQLEENDLPPASDKEPHAQ